MKFDLDIPQSSKSQDFLDYFNSKIREVMLNYQGSCSEKDDHYITTVSGLFAMEQSSFPLEWKLVQDKEKGTIKEILVETTDSKYPESDWSELVRKFYNSVLLAAFKGEKKPTFAENYITTLARNWMENTGFQGIGLLR